MDEGNRFRRALNNPFVMMGLCLMAGIAFYINAIEPTMNSSVTPAIARYSSSLKNPLVKTALEQPHEEEARQWIENPKRDPFAPVSVAKWLKPYSPEIQVRRHGPLQQFELKAIALETQQRSAVINRSVVYEGEMIEGYEVVSIELQGVWLQRHGKKHLLTFTTRTAS
jgi:hypothetical protein